MNDIFYHLTSASLSWNPFIYFLHTIHIIPPPDIVTGWHILCLIYFSCTIQVLIKQEQRFPHSWCHYTNFQKGTAPLFAPAEWPSGFIIGQRGHLLGSLETSVLKALSTPDTHSIDHMANSAPVHTQSLDKLNIIFYILNRPHTIAIAKHRFYFHRTISVLIFK